MFPAGGMVRHSENVAFAMRRSRSSQPALGTAIRELRESRELTQEAVAQKASVTPRILRGIESGHGNPTWATVTAVLAALDVSLSDLAKKIDGGG
jgi:transcriptional regulator with XRE-family HTH domain